MNSKNILHVTKKFESDVYGGIESVVDSLCKNLKKKNIKSSVYTIMNIKVKKRNYNIFSSKKNFEVFSTPFSISAFYDFYKISKNYDLIIFHFPWPFMDILSLLIPKKKIFIFYHADIINKNILYFFYLPLKKYFFSRSKKIICTSKNLLKTSTFLKSYRHKTVILPIGINKKKPSALSKNFSILKKKKYFIFVGNLRDYKGIFFLIEIFKKINDANLLILGDGKDRIKLIKHIKNLKNVYYYSKFSESEKISCIKNSKALILPSLDRREAFGIVLLEAASLKVPMLSTKLGTGTTFINKHNITGFTFDPDNQSDITKYIKLLNKKSSLSSKMGNNAYLRFNRYFKLDKMINKFNQIISD